MKTLRYGVVAILMLMLLLLGGCGSQTGEGNPQEVGAETTKSSTMCSPTLEKETYPILDASISYMPVTGTKGHVSANVEVFLTFVCICYEKNGEIVFNTLNIHNNDGTYEVYFQLGEENKVSMEEKEIIWGQYKYNRTIYTIYLTEETYQSIF